MTFDGRIHSAEKRTQIGALQEQDLCLDQATAFSIFRKAGAKGSGSAQMPALDAGYFGMWFGGRPGREVAI